MTQLVQSKKDNEVEFIPFGTQSKIKLSLSIIRNYVAEPGKSGELPDDRQCMKFMMLCRARQADPFQGDAFMIPFFNTRKNCYEWSMVTAIQALLKRAEVHPDYNGKESGIIVDKQACLPCAETGQIEGQVCPKCNGLGYWDEIAGDFLPDGMTLLGGWCKVYYKTKTKVEHQRLKLSTYRKKTSQWDDDAPGMICKCAEAASLRSAFPTTIGGLYLREEKEAFGFARPEFDVPQVTAEPPVTQPPPAAAIEGTAKGKMDQIKRVRNWIKAEKGSETELIKDMVSGGVILKEYDSLEEMVLNEPDSIKWIISSLMKEEP